MDVRLPDGTIIRNVPDGTTKADLVAKLKANGMAVPSEWLEAKTAAKQPEYDPTEGMSGTDKFLAGAGKAMVDIGRGAGQLAREGIEFVAPPQRSTKDLILGTRGKSFADTLGLPTQQDIDDAKRLDAPLMKTGAGIAGNITGNVAVALPTVFIPGANTVTGSALVGAGMGALNPVATGESRLENIGLGGALGAGSVILARGAKAGYQGLKALAEPFYEGGRQNIAARMLQRFAENPASIRGATSAPTITGARPTLAEQTGDRGIASLQDALRSLDPQIDSAIGARLGENNAARVNTLRQLAGEDGAREFADAARGATAQQLYGDAFAVMPNGLTSAQERTMKTLMRMPAIKQAMNEARAMAANRGTNVGPANGSGSIEGLHTMKLALDDQINAVGTGSAAQANKASSIKAARDALVNFIEELSPDYKAARTVYADMSKPVNSYDIGAEVLRRATSNTSDLAGNPRMQANALMGLLRDEGGLIRRATGRPVANSLDQVMEPDALALLRAVASESDRAAAVASAGAGPGSATAKRMASQNVLRQLVGPTGLPESWGESVLANTVVGKPLNLVYGGVAEPKIQQLLAEAVLDPTKAQAVLDAALKAGVKLPPSTLRQLTAAAARISVPAAGLVAGER